jgi:hypothetical protein
MPVVARPLEHAPQDGLKTLVVVVEEPCERPSCAHQVWTSAIVSTVCVVDLPEHSNQQVVDGQLLVCLRD